MDPRSPQVVIVDESLRAICARENDAVARLLVGVSLGLFQVLVLSHGAFIQDDW
ncbi:hypothetical protein BD410DRAFT_794392 [Rickenella mellea]|uniref:Uncharacterized protein n=1 Tax=Rickenella mellea TaxID=50990 RepID=A0A4Y7PQI6_9AGAM|nr:hypothetical protein BD410DRAFT_794392 [Rickenella mellea]